MKFACPLPTALTAITQPTCAFRFDQIVKFAFQQRQSAAPFATSTAFKTLSNWTTLLAASDATKIVASPIFTGMVIPSSEGNFAGANDNANFDGLEDYFGDNPVRVTGHFKNLPPQAKADMDVLTQFSIANAIGVSMLTVFMFNKDGQAFSDALYKGIPIYNFRVGSTGSEGLNKADLTPFSFNLTSKWDRALLTEIPLFDPLTQL